MTGTSPVMTALVSYSSAYGDEPGHDGPPPATSPHACDAAFLPSAACAAARRAIGIRNGEQDT
jgi:hypothetical protein